MKEFDELVEIRDALHGPRGCPWDKKQTFASLRPYILEETHELLEALDAEDRKGIVEEMGDVLFHILFLAKLGEKEEAFSLKQVIEEVCRKLVRRHPHVFGDLEVQTTDEVIAHWERIKKEEKKERKAPIEGIPKTLGGLARAQKVIATLDREKIPLPQLAKGEEGVEGISLGSRLLALAIEAHRQGEDAESQLRLALKSCEQLLS